MPTTSQAIVFTPRRYVQWDQSATQPKVSSVKKVPLHESNTSTATNNTHPNVQSLQHIPDKASSLSLLAKILIGVGVVAVVATATAVPLGVVLSRQTATTTTASTVIVSNTTTGLSPDIFWSFDNTTLDLYNNFNANTSNGPSYVASYITIGAALRLTRSSSQYATVTTPQLLFNSTSFTIEAWIYPISLNTADYAIFGQCALNSTNLCMFFIVRNLKLFCSFTNNDVQGSTSLTSNTWSHVACVYNLATQTKQVWLNRVLDGTQSSSTAYLGTSGQTTIGVTYLTPPGSNFFNGYLDQMKFTFRAKTSTELLRAATLVVHYSFMNGLFTDNGPLGINGTITGNVTIVTGRVNQAVQVSSGSYVSQSYAGFYRLRISGYPFSMALWVKPSSAYVQSAIVFVMQPGSWCVSFVTMQSNGQLMLNLWTGSSTSIVSGPIIALNGWTHIGYTYSSANGMRLYVNGTLYGWSGPFVFSAASGTVAVTLGSNLGKNYCAPRYGGAFNGVVDEFYVYSHELVAAEISSLANP